MCRDCGCGDPEMLPVEVGRKILAKNDAEAEHNRRHLAATGVLAINLMGSPGSGKTALLEATARAIGGRFRLGAVSGDLATDRDGERLRRAGIPARTITTGSACHLDAHQIHRALHDPALAGVDVFVVENVGNLVCPAVYDLGQAVNVVALSVTEGDDKPLKYPVMFAKADLVVWTKLDLEPHLPGFSRAALADALARVAPRAETIETSAITGLGIDAFTRWLEARRPRRIVRARVPVALDR